MEITDRFLAIIDDIHAKMAMSQSEIERRSGMSSVISNVRSGKVDPSLLTVCKLLKAFPDYSAEWILLGTGSMLKSGGEMAILKKQNEQLMRLNIVLQERLRNYEK